MKSFGERSRGLMRAAEPRLKKIDHGSWKVFFLGPFLFVIPSCLLSSCDEDGWFDQTRRFYGRKKCRGVLGLVVEFKFGTECVGSR